MRLIDEAIALELAMEAVKALMITEVDNVLMTLLLWAEY